MSLKNILKHPVAKGMAAGSTIGAGMGYLGADKDKKLRGTLGGAGLGGFSGGLAGVVHKVNTDSAKARAGWSHQRSPFHGGPSLDEHLKNLGVKKSNTFTKAEVKQKFRDQARKHHPDVGGSTHKMQDINNSWSNVQNSDWFKKLSHVQFWTGFEKQASAFAHAAELGGLGILATPAIRNMQGKPMSEKNKDRAEVAGLGVLAAPSAVAAGKGLVSNVKKYAPVVGNFMRDSYMKGRLARSFMGR